MDRPRQVIVSDMTAFKFWILNFDVTFYFDVFTKEILTYKVAARKGDRNQYIKYDTPVNYRKRFFKGELPRRNTFENRVLTEEPCPETP